MCSSFPLSNTLIRKRRVCYILSEVLSHAYAFLPRSRFIKETKGKRGPSLVADLTEIIHVSCDPWEVRGIGCSLKLCSAR